MTDKNRTELQLLYCNGDTLSGLLKYVDAMLAVNSDYNYNLGYGNRRDDEAFEKWHERD